MVHIIESYCDVTRSAKIYRDRGEDKTGLKRAQSDLGEQVL